MTKPTTMLAAYMGKGKRWLNKWISTSVANADADSGIHRSACDFASRGSHGLAAVVGMSWVVLQTGFMPLIAFMLFSLAITAGAIYLRRKVMLG